MSEKRGVDPTPAGQAAEGRSVTVSVDLPEDLVAALDRAIVRSQPGMTRAEALIVALRDWATARGLVAGKTEGLKPDELNASNDD